MNLTHRLFFAAFFLLFLLMPCETQAQSDLGYVVMSSSISYNSTTNKVNGVSQTTLSYAETSFYMGKAKSYIYTQNPATPLTIAQAQGVPGQSTVSITTQTTASPGVQYNLRTEHFVLPTIVSYGQYYDYGLYIYRTPYYTGVTNYGATQTIQGCYTNYPYGPLPGCYAAIVYDWIGLGNTNTSTTTPGSVTITNPRISGNLAGHTESSLVGAIVNLTAGGLPASGSQSYAWTFTGSPTIVSGGANQASVGVRWTQPSTFRATVTYTFAGGSAQAFLDVNNKIPTLTSFAGTQSSDVLARDQFCSNLNAGVTYTLGCYTGVEEGMIWSATAQIPAASYLSDLAESGIKFVQAVSTYRKRLREGNVECFTARSVPTNVASGWQLDTTDPYNHLFEHPVRYFSEGTTLAMGDFDAPGRRIEGTASGVFFSDDADIINDIFETYVFYFTGDPAHPTFQRAISLQGSASPYARLVWSWGGASTFDFSKPPVLFRSDSDTVSGATFADGTSAIVPISTNVNKVSWGTCPGTTATSNLIDSSRFFVLQQYRDFLNRQPDTSGWNFWRSNITTCSFDLACVSSKRVDVARAFFYSTEFIGAHPELGGTRGTHDYNTAFVYWCYRAFLRREPNGPPDNNWDGYNFWVGKLDSTNPDAGDAKYNEMLHAFIESIEYRNRPFAW